MSVEEATAQGEIAASAWVTKLAEDARKAREGAEVKPKLWPPVVGAVGEVGSIAGRRRLIYA